MSQVQQPRQRSRLQILVGAGAPHLALVQNATEIVIAMAIVRLGSSAGKQRLARCRQAATQPGSLAISIGATRRRMSQVQQPLHDGVKVAVEVPRGSCLGISRRMPARPPATRPSRQGHVHEGNLDAACGPMLGYLAQACTSITTPPTIRCMAG